MSMWLFSKKVRVALATLFCLFMIGGMTGQALAAGAAAASQKPSRYANTHIVPMSEVAQVAQFWTAERMRAAVAVDRQFNRGGGQHTRSSEATAGAKSMPVPPGRYSSYPYSAIGKVFFLMPAGPAECSGTVVHTPGGNIVDTAGHCVAQGGSGDLYYTSWMFCPQYIDGTCPKGRWVATALTADPGWLNDNNPGRDDAYATMLSPGGQTLESAIGGGVPLAFNLPSNQTYTALGYPAAPPFTGERMYRCVSRKVASDSSVSPPTTGIACSMTEGSSGGGWLILSNGKWYLNGHTDYRIDGQPGVLYSPYYDTEVQQLYSAVMG